MNEQVRIGKTFVCECGKSFAFDLATEASIENISVTVNCPKCGSSHYLTAETLLKNISKTTSSTSSYSASSTSSSGGMGMFDSPLDTPSSSSYSNESTSSESKDESYVPLMELFE
ncbi:hypothetical protein HY992_05595 [Candidatus Micrarchaeota archaeon]|nr:hypothetical protein [Candidatus Micrarchaeota archaeon]